MVVRRIVAMANPEQLRTCRGCGCDDNHACVTEHGACAWFLVDIYTPTGVCTVCAVEVRFDPRHLSAMGADVVEALLARRQSGLVLP